MSTTRKPGPNDLLPCPSEACRRWHCAHGIDHDCRVNIPHPRRVDGIPWKQAA